MTLILTRRHTILAGVIAFAVLGLAISLIPARVDVTHPTRGPAVQGVYATGTVEASVMLPIAGRATARLVELRADEGVEVSKDQILGRLESEDMRNALQALRAREAWAKKELERASQLRAERKISQQELDKAQADWDAARSSAAQAQVQAQYFDLKAPENGRIIRRDGEVGELIPTGQPVFWIAVTSPLRITSEVDEEDIAQVQPGQAVAIRADAFPGQVFSGKVKSITPKGDPVARSYRVRIELTESTPLQIGMTAETNIVIRETVDALLIPSSALTEDQVWTLNNSTAARRRVNVGARGPVRTEILSGLETSDLVVISPPEALKEGERVSFRLRELD